MIKRVVERHACGGGDFTTNLEICEMVGIIPTIPSDLFANLLNTLVRIKSPILNFKGYNFNKNGIRVRLVKFILNLVVSS